MKISPLRNGVSEEAEYLKAQLYGLLLRIRITDLLAEVLALPVVNLHADTRPDQALNVRRKNSLHPNAFEAASNLSKSIPPAIWPPEECRK